VRGRGSCSPDGHVERGAGSVWVTRSPGAVVGAACGQRWSSSSPIGGDDGVQEGGVQTASGCSAAPPPTSGCEAPPPLSGGRRQLQAAVHVAATLAGGQRWSERAVAQAGGQHGHSDTGRRATWQQRHEWVGSMATTTGGRTTW
jgi:hypothetical protein